MKFLRYIEIFVVQDVEIFDYTIENWFSIETNVGKIMMISSIEFQLVLFNEKAKHFEHEHLQAISILKCTNVIYYFKLVTEWVGEWVSVRDRAVVSRSRNYWILLLFNHSFENKLTTFSNEAKCNKIASTNKIYCHWCRAGRERAFWETHFKSL